MTEAELKRKLAAIESMVLGAMTEGERAAAQHVLENFKQKTPDETCQDLGFTVHDVWARNLFMAMLRKAGLEPFRMRGQRRTTIMVRTRVAYARVSTAEQAERDLSLPAQRKAIAEFAARHGATIAQEYVEAGASGTDANRPELNRLLGDALKPTSAIGTIVVHHTSRFTRDATHARVGFVVAPNSLS